MSCIFVFLLPSILGLKFIMKFNEDRKLKDIVVDYLLLVLISNFICMSIVVLINKFDGSLINYTLEHLKFSVKYLAISLIINVILSFIYSVFIKCVDIKLEVKRENKEDIKNNEDNN